MDKTAEMNVSNNENEIRENERLFGKNVDHYIGMQCCLILSRLFRGGSINDVKHSDSWEDVAKYIKREELQKLAEELPQINNAEVPAIRDDNFEDIASGLLAKYYGEIANRKFIWRRLAEIMGTRAREYREIVNGEGYTPHLLQTRMAEMQKTLGLDEHECDIILTSFLMMTGQISTVDFIYPFRETDYHTLARAIGVEDEKIMEYVQEGSNLRKYGIVNRRGSLLPLFMDFLMGLRKKAFSENFWTESTEEALPWNFYGKIAEDDGQSIIDIIESKPAQKGCSILLYGAAGAGKTSFAQSLAHKLGRKLYFIAQHIINRGMEEEEHIHYSCSTVFRYFALAIAQHMLDPEKSIIVVDECDDMIEANMLNCLSSSYAPKDEGGSIKGEFNNVLDNNRHTIIWICNSHQEAIAGSSRRRFDYSVLFDELLPENRVRIWENCLARENCVGKLSAEYISDASRKYKINAGGIALAVQDAAAIVAKHPEKSFENCVSKFLKAHCELLGIHQTNDEYLEPARDYSLEGLNIRSGISPERIIKVCRKFLNIQNTPGQLGRDKLRMNLLLHGVPGSGKTEFIKYLAKQLGRKLNIKNASDLLSKWVGGTERLLANAFAEAEKNNEILFIDEGDSMLASRDCADRNWEISQVNTLLTEMEKFSGIFAVSTNLIQKLDPAALRRFTFRIHFDFLNDAGKEIFYRTYFGPLNVPELTEADRVALYAIERLTPSDYRNVRQQFFYLEESDLSAAEIIEALKLEAESRDSYRDYKGLGEEKHGIGFNN